MSGGLCLGLLSIGTLFTGLIIDGLYHGRFSPVTLLRGYDRELTSEGGRVTSPRLQSAYSVGTNFDCRVKGLVGHPARHRHQHRRKLPANSGGLDHGPFLPLPSPFPPPPLPSPPFSSPLLPPLPSLPLSLEVGPPNPARGSGERCIKLPQRGLGQSRSRNRFWCILALKSVIWWQQF